MPENSENFALPGLMNITRPRLDAQPADILIRIGEAFEEDRDLPEGIADFTGYTVEASVRYFNGSPDEVVALETDIPDAEAASVRLSLSAGASSSLEKGTYVCDLRLSPDGLEWVVFARDVPVYVRY